MAFTVTGGKYALQTITAVGTTTVTVNSAVPFVVADFASVQRIVALYTSSSVFKGIAYVRSATSTTALALETEFFDPVDGSVKTQVIGDKVLVSKTWAECATTGWAVSGNTSTISDFCTIGTAGNEASACIYDEYKTLTSSLANISTFQVAIAGGVWVQGHCQDWGSQITYGGCDYVATNTTSTAGIGVQGTAAHYFVFGGRRVSTTGQLVWEPATNANTIDRCKSLVWMNVDTVHGILGPNGGGSPWAAGTEGRVWFYNCEVVGTGASAIAWRPSNGNVSGGVCKVTSSTGLAAFGSGYNGFAIGAPSGKRFVVSDLRGTARLWDQFSPNQSVTVNFTNLWTPVETVSRQAAGSTTTFNFRWKSAYSNLVIGSLIQILKEDGVTTEASAFVSTSSTDLTVLSRTRSGTNVMTVPITYTNNDWTYAIWLYGYVPIGGSFSRTTQPLGSGTTSEVAHGGVFSQTVDTYITQANVDTVAAYTTVADLGALYDLSMRWKALSTANMKWQGISTRTFSPVGTTMTMAGTIIFDAAAANAYSPNTATDVLTVNAVTVAPTARLSTLAATSIQVNAGVTVSAGLSGPVTNAGTISGTVTGNVTNTGTLASGARITGNVTQATPSDLTGVTIAGDLTFNTNSNVAITLTGATISGTVSNTGTGTVTVAVAGGSTVGTFGSGVVAKPATVTFSGLPAGARAVVYEAGVMSETATSTGATLAMTTTYPVGTALTYRIFHASRTPAAGSITLASAGANQVPVSMPAADGLTAGATVKTINGTTINANGQVSIDTTAKTVTFDAPVDIRAALTALQGAWVGQSALYSQDIPVPFTLESVSGLLIRNDWTLVAPDTSTGEGYALFDPANEALTQVNLNFISKGNTADMQVGLVYDGTTQPVTTMPGELDYLFLNVDPAPTLIQVRALVKRQDIVFIDRTETLRTGGTWSRFFRNAQTSFAQTTDPTVTALLPADTAKYRLVQSTFTPPVDNNGTTHTFARVIEVETGISSRADLVNQIAAVATFDDYYRAKPYTVNAAGKIVMETGTWVRYRDGSPLSGNAAALFTFTSTAGEYIQPETRLLSIKLDDRATLGCSYVVYREDTGAVLLDASGLEVTGTLTTTNRSVLITVQSSVAIDLVVATVGANVAEGYAPVTLASGTSTVTIATTQVTVVTPPENQTLNDPVTGVLAWNPIITEAIFDTTAKDIIIPTQTVDGQVVKSYNLAYLYMAWRRWINADVRRMRHGWAVYAEHQLAPPGAADLSYKFTPGVVFNDAWALNVPATRSASDIVRLEASNIGRRDTTANSGLVYRSPLANGATTMAEVVISGAATEVIRNAYNQTVANAREIERLKNAAGWLTGGGKLLGIKPLAGDYDPNNDYGSDL